METDSDLDLKQAVDSEETVAVKSCRVPQEAILGLPKPYYQDEYVTLYHGDCRELLPLMPRVDLVLTDPPYGIGYVPGDNKPGATKYNVIANDENTKIVEELFKYYNAILSWCVFGANNFPHLLPHRGRWICWDKRCSESADKMLGSSFELAWTNRTNGFDKMFRVLHGGVVNKNGGKRVHPTEKPITLMSQILQSIYPDKKFILDPFAGSGTTLRAAKDLGLSCIGIELEEKYCEVAANRMRQEILGL